MNSAPVSVLVHVLWCTYVYTVVGHEEWDCEPRRGRAFSFRRFCQVVLQSDCAVSSILIMLSLSVSETSRRSCPAGSRLHGSEQSVRKLGLKM